MKLSKRLEAVATLVDIKSRVIDVGCDHAYLDIYLTIYNSNTCIATDINENALNIAKNNIRKYNLEKKIRIILTDGLKDIDLTDNDNIVICGMGTNTILKILNTNKLSDTLILSSNNHYELLRRELVKLGYYIDTELFLFDKRKPYVIIKFKKGYKKYKNIDYYFGPVLKYNQEYIKYIKRMYKSILKSISMKKIYLKLKYIYILIKISILGFIFKYKKNKGTY